MIFWGGAGIFVFEDGTGFVTRTVNLCTNNAELKIVAELRRRTPLCKCLSSSTTDRATNSDIIVKTHIEDNQANDEQTRRRKVYKTQHEKSWIYHRDGEEKPCRRYGLNKRH